MPDFAKMTLVQGLEEILVNDSFVEGTAIVATIEELLKQGQVENEGKVLTIISERKAEALESLVTTTRVESENTVLQERVVASANPAIAQLVNLLEQRAEQGENGQQQIAELTNVLSSGGSIAGLGQSAEKAAYPQEISVLIEKMLAAYNDDQEKSQHFLQQLTPYIDKGELPQGQASALKPEVEKIVQRLSVLPERYSKILMQLLGNWENQVQLNKEAQLRTAGNKINKDEQ